MKLICSLFITFLKIGAFTFGGGYAMIALLENEFVEKKKWLEKSEFLDMVAVAESTPGPVAINSATYIGYKIAGFAGATMSTLAVSIPSFFV
ncbi:MAG: chromate transporter, partial [Gemmiger sp.]|nr:chromate transporter [Gemmiger sp.]